MKILFLSSHPAVSLMDSQGYAIRIAELIDSLKELGHEVVPLIAGDEKGRQTAQRVYKQRIKRWIPAPIAQIVRELSFLLLDYQLYRRYCSQVAVIAPDVIVERYSFFDRTGMWLAEYFGLPLVLDDISPTWEEEIYFRRALKGLAHRIQRQVFQRADGLVAVSTPIKTHLLSLGVPQEKIRLIHNGADCERFSPAVDGRSIREKYGLQNKIVVGFVGGFLPWQGVETLLDVALDWRESAANIRFLLVGPAHHWSSLGLSLERKMMVAQESGRVIFAGAIPHQDVPSYLAAMDIVTVPDFNEYGNPIKIFEYMAMGKPLIAPRVPSIAEIVTHRQDGWLMEHSSPENLKGAILELAQSPELREQIGTKARKAALQKFTWHRGAQQLEALLETVCRTREMTYQTVAATES